MFGAVVRNILDPSFHLAFNIEEAAVPRKGDYMAFNGLEDQFKVEYVVWGYTPKSPTTLDHSVQVNIFVVVENRFYKISDWSQ